MSRNASGNYTLPLPPVAPGTLVESAWANDTLDDLAQAMTDSLDRYGRGGMLAPFKFLDGDVAAPGITFGNEPTSGFYREAQGVVSLSIQGVRGWSCNTTGVTAKEFFATVTTPSSGSALVNKDYVTNALATYQPLATAWNTSNFDPNTKASLGGNVSFSYISNGNQDNSGYLRAAALYSNDLIRAGYGTSRFVDIGNTVLGQYTGLRMYYSGVAEWSLGVFADGSMRTHLSTTQIQLLDTGGNLYQYGILFGRNGGGGSRVDTGFRHTPTGADIGKAPGLARGVVVLDGNGTATVGFPFSIGSPRVQVTINYSGTPAICGVNNVSTTGFVIWGSAWNGSNWQVAPGATVYWEAIDESITPG